MNLLLIVFLASTTVRIAAGENGAVGCGGMGKICQLARLGKRKGAKSTRTTSLSEKEQLLPKTTVSKTTSFREEAPSLTKTTSSNSQASLPDAGPPKNWKEEVPDRKMSLELAPIHLQTDREHLTSTIRKLPWLGVVAGWWKEPQFCIVSLFYPGNGVTESDIVITGPKCVDKITEEGVLKGVIRFPDAKPYFVIGTEYVYGTDKKVPIFALLKMNRKRDLGDEATRLHIATQWDGQVKDAHIAWWTNLYSPTRTETPSMVINDERARYAKYSYDVPISVQGGKFYATVDDSSFPSAQGSVLYWYPFEGTGPALKGVQVTGVTYRIEPEDNFADPTGFMKQIREAMEKLMKEGG